MTMENLGFRLLSALAAFATAGTAAIAQDPPEYRAVYAATFDINTRAKCDAIIDRVLSRNINAVFVEVRARGDAYYHPNREDPTYPNPEPRGQLYAISPSDLDVLQLFIDRLHAADPPVEVHAWCTTFNSWNRSFPPSDPDHIYNAHPEWITEDSAGVTYTWEDDAALDPGIPAVQDHIFNVFMDIARNYDIDGLHFDYVRLLGADSGYDPVALARFQAETGWTFNPAAPGPLAEVYEAWRRDQIAQVVQRVHRQVNLEKPWVEVSAYLVNFTDSVENLAQGYNWWVANGAIDLLVPSCYSSSVAGGVSDWQFFVNKLSQSGDESTRPMVAAVGSYLLEPAENAQTVTTLRANSRPTDGFNFFDQGALFTDGTPPDASADALFEPGGPMDAWAPIPAMAHKPGEEAVAPNPPASATVTLADGSPRVTFDRPAAAADGDLPVHYRLYRDTDADVDLIFENMVMEWWDLGSSRTSFLFDDVTAPAGGVHYAAVAYDDWNNGAAATVGPISPTVGEIIIESHTPQDTVTPVPAFNQSGSWYAGGSTAKSTAPGLTGVGSEFSTSGSIDASCTFRPTIPSAGTYGISVTTPSAGSVNAPNSQFSIAHAGGTTTGTIALTSANTGDRWTPLASGIPLSAGTGGSVTFTETAPQPDRFYADAVRFVPSGLSPTPKEPFPGVTAPVSDVTEVIVDSHPPSLAYDDDGNDWSTSTLPGYYDGNARFYSMNNTFPPTSHGVWVIDLPVAGRWAIDGWVRNNVSFATAAQYRFVDGGGTVHSVTATHRTGVDDPGSGGWFIDVDGVEDVQAPHFEAGRVYVTLYGNAAGAQTLIADALRFRLIGGMPVGISLRDAP